MADPQQLQQQVEQLNDELNKINDRIGDIGENLSKGVVNQLSNSISRTRTLADNLSKSRDLSKDLKATQSELNKSIAKSEALSLSKRISEEKFRSATEAFNNAQSALEKIAAGRRLIKARDELKSISMQLQLNEAIEDEIRKLITTAEQRKRETDLAENLFQALEKNLGVTRQQIKEMTTLTGLFTLIIDRVFAADRQATELAKSLGLSKGAAMDIRQEFVEYSRAAGDSFVNTDRLLKAQQGLTEQLGIAVKFSGEETEQFARLTEIVGLSNEEAGKLAEFSAATGKNTKDYVADLRKGAFSAMQANRIHISDKELLSTIGKLSAGILVKFQNNPKALAEAVIQAKKLGLNLEQVNKIGDSMLEWESSIENELEAELITGKKLNFERARAAALTGDQATLMQEVASQAGSLAEFQNMNVIAQSSLAKAFGMNREEMSEMLMKQEAVNKYGDKAAELNAEQLKDMEKRNMTVDQYLKMQEEQRSAQENFNDLMTKLQQTIADLVSGPLGTFLSLIMSILDSTVGFSMVIGALLGSQIPGLIKGFQSVAKIVKSAAKYSIAEAVAKAATSAASMGPVGWALAGGVAAGLGALLYTYLADDMVSTPGYGKRTILSPEGSIKLNDNDTIIAGTNLGAGKAKSESNTGMIAAISNLATAMNNKPTPTPQFALNVDGQQLGSVVGRQQETGTQQTKNAYRLA
jgi:hypothetical protein